MDLPEKTQMLELPALFKSLVKKMTKEWKKRVIDKLSMSQFRMLYILNEVGPRKTMELAEALSVTSGAITGMADKLIGKGLIERNRDDNDRRVVYLQITNRGKGVMESLLENQKEMISAFFEGLPAEDIRHLKRIFTTMLNQIKETDKE